MGRINSTKTFSLFILLLSIIGGSSLRLLPLNLPFYIIKWGGSWFWGMLFWALTTIFLRTTKSTLVILYATLLTTISEGLKLIHVPILEKVRTTYTGSFLLGHQFNINNIFVYIFSITTTEAIFLYYRNIAK